MEVSVTLKQVYSRISHSFVQKMLLSTIHTYIHTRSDVVPRAGNKC